MYHTIHRQDINYINLKIIQIFYTAYTTIDAFSIVHNKNDDPSMTILQYNGQKKRERI